MHSHIFRVVSLFIFVLAIGMAAQRAEDSGAEVASTGRGPASIPNEGKLRLFKPSNEFLKHTEKIHGPVAVELDLLGAKPEKAGDVFVLQAKITSSAALDKLNYKWSIPAGVTVVNGQTGGVLDHPASASVVELTLQANENVNEQIHIIVSGDQSGMGFAEGAQYNTLDQDMINARKEELLESTRAYMQGEKLKVIH